MTSLRRPAVRSVLWACLLIGIATGAGVAGLHWWVIPVVGGAWILITSADRVLERRLAAAEGARAAEAAPAPQRDEEDQLLIVSALVAGAGRPEPGGPAAPGEVADREPGEPEPLVTVSAVVAGPPREPPAEAPPLPEEVAELDEVPAPEQEDALLSDSAVVAAPPAAPAEAVPPAPVAPEPPPAQPEAAPVPSPAPAAPQPEPPPRVPVERPLAAPVGAGLEKRWSIWTLDRVARETDQDELKFLVFSLQDYADIDGLLPIQFDSLVRESFGEFLGSAAA
jgi:hypothetical protein